MMARPEKTPRQSVTERKFCKGVVAPNAPNPPATICKPFIIGSRSLWNQITKALKAAIKQAETPNPISNLPAINPEAVSEFEKIHAPRAANKSNADSVRLGPNRSSNIPKGSWNAANEKK